ncbi:MAG: hypothetical protein JWQ99_3844 [Blastococcus sp.]|jgi:hypothetical protein|nr:hypothetical protein [Blastococcus sp.]
MTAHDVRETVSTSPLPHPRVAADDTLAPEPTAALPAKTAALGQDAHYPWPEPWRFSRGARPRTEFWDVETASWRSRGPVAVPPKTD